MNALCHFVAGENPSRSRVAGTSCSGRLWRQCEGRAEGTVLSFNRWIFPNSKKGIPHNFCFLLLQSLAAAYKAAAEVRDFSEYRYQSTLQRELAVALCKLWSLAAEVQKLEELQAGLSELDDEHREACRQALKLMKREQALVSDAARPPAAPSSSGPADADSKRARSAAGGEDDKDEEEEVEAALAALPWDEGVQNLQLESLQTSLAQIGFG